MVDRSGSVTHPWQNNSHRGTTKAAFEQRIATAEDGVEGLTTWLDNDKLLELCPICKQATERDAIHEAVR